MKSVKETLNVFSIFQRYGGLKANIDKTQAIPIGSLKDLSKQTAYGLDWSSNHVYSLGVTFTKNSIDNYNDNFKPKIEKLKNLTKIWKGRKLSLKGKITVTNSLGLSPFIYLAGCINVPARVYKEVNDIILNFLCGNTNAKISLNTLISNTESGGLKLIDLKLKTISLKVAWIKRLCSSDDANWKIIPKFWYQNDDLYKFFNQITKPCQ